MGSILTNTGRIKLATATPEVQLNITQIAVGDGNGGFPSLTPDMTGLTNEVWRGTVSAPIRSDDDTTIIFEGFIASSIGGFYVREVAIFDEDGDMIAIGHTSEIEKPDPDSGNPASLSIRLHVALSSAEQVDLIYNDDPTIDHNGLSNRDSNDSHPSSAISTEALSGIGQSESDVFSILSLLKTAALYNAQTSKTDNTSGALLSVGAFGLGSILPTIENWDDTSLQTGIYRPTNNASGDRPTGNAGSVIIHCRSTDTLQSQLCLQSNYAQPRTYRRNYSSADGWGSWVELLDSDTVHNDLDGRSTSDAHPATAIQTSALTKLGFTSNSTVQAVLAALGTAATATKQTSTTDSTENSLMQVGAFGIGSSAIPTIGDIDATDIETGIYRPSSADGDLPSNNAGSVLIHVRSTATIQSQLFLQSNNSLPRTFRRNYSSSGWGSWVEVLDTGNAEADMVSSDNLPNLGLTDPTVQTALSSIGSIALLGDDHNNISGRSSSDAHPATAISTTALSNLGLSASTVQAALAALGTAATKTAQTSDTDSTANALMQVGAFGLGSSAIPAITNVDDTDLETGIYRPSDASGDLPSNNAGSVLIHVRTTANIQSQMFLQSASGQPRTYRRNYSSGGWGSWVELQDSGNNDEVGCVKYFITTVTPSGRYIKANGAAVSRTAYADLFAKVGTFWGDGDGSTTFNVPDLRGEFIRTWDDGRGLDSGRSFGVVQDGQIEAHTHGLTNEGSAQAGNDNGGAPISSATGFTTTRELSDTESYGGSETRPRNISLIAWIRY